MSGELMSVEARPKRLAPRRADASTDTFVLEHMALGAPVVRATRYSQSVVSSAFQYVVVGIPFAVAVVAALASVPGGAIGVVAAMMGLGVLTLLENSNRVVLTQDALVVQNNIFLRRYELDKIEQPRVETLAPGRWTRFDSSLFDPRDIFRRTTGLRFCYRKSETDTKEVFIAAADADEYLRLLAC